MNFEQRVKLNYDNLSESDKEMVSYIQHNKKEVVGLSAVEFGERVLSSKSSVSRLSKKLGLNGFSELKYILSQGMNQTFIPPEDFVSQLKENIDKTFQYSNQVNFQPLLTKMKSCKSLYIYATGFTQNNYSKEFSNDLFLSGKPNFLISGETNFDMISQTLTSEDLVIITSLSGETRGINDIIKNLYLNKIPVCSVTAFGKNFLSDNSEYQLYYEVSDLPNATTGLGKSMIGLNTILTILSYKYREFILFDE